MLLVYIMLEFRNEYLWKRLEFMCKRIKLPSQKWIRDFTSAYFPSMAFLEQTFLSVCEFNAPVNVLYWFLWFLFIYIAVLWLSRVNVEASTALNHSTKLTSVEKVSSQEGNKNVNDKYKEKKKNTPFDAALTESHDTLRSDEPPPVMFPCRKLYTETDQIWFENINSIYLKEEMRCWVRGGAAAFKHDSNRMAFSSR